MLHEDLLRVSAASIFQANLGGTDQKVYSAQEQQAVFEEVLGAAVSTPLALYESVERQSIDAIEAANTRRSF